MQFLVCSIPEDASARVRTRSPGYQMLHERNVKGGHALWKKGRKTCTLPKTMFFFFPVSI